MEQLALKLTLIAVMFVMSVISGILPLKLLQFLRKRAASALDIDEEKRWPSLLLCLVTCFSGGVFLATCFLHLMPEVTDKMQEIMQEYQWPASYPLAELISCAGFFLVFLIEELVILCLRGHHHHHGSSGHRHQSGSFVHVHVVQTPGSPPAKSGATSTTKIPINKDGIQKPPPPSFLTGSDDEDERAEMKALTESNIHPAPGAKVIGRENGLSIVSTGAELRSPPFPVLSPCGDLSPTKQPASPRQVTINEYGQKADEHSIPFRGLPHKLQNGHGHDHSGNTYGSGYHSPSPDYDGDIFTFIDGDISPFVPKSLQNGTVASSPTWMRRRHSSCCSDEDGNCPGIELPLNAEPECCEGPCDGQKEDPPIMMAYRPHAHSHGVRSITLVVALSFHSLIEGLAFGIQDTTTKTWAIFLGIIIHKCIIIFSTGVQLARTHAHQLVLVVVTIVLVSLMSPIGAGVGVAVEQTWGHSEARDVTIMFFSGLSVGTFLYVTFFEVLIHERDNEHNNLLKLFAILVGFILMAALRAMEDKHNHGGGDHHHDNVTATTSFLETTSAYSSTRLV